MKTKFNTTKKSICKQRTAGPEGPGAPTSPSLPGAPCKKSFQTHLVYSDLY